MHGEEITVVGKRLLTMITFAVPNELWMEDIQVRCRQRSASAINGQRRPAAVLTRTLAVSSQRSAISSAVRTLVLGGFRPTRNRPLAQSGNARQKTVIVHAPLNSQHLPTQLSTKVSTFQRTYSLNS